MISRVWNTLLAVLCIVIFANLDAARGVEGTNKIGTHNVDSTSVSMTSHALSGSNRTKTSLIRRVQLCARHGDACGPGTSIACCPGLWCDIPDRRLYGTCRGFGLPE